MKAVYLPWLHMHQPVVWTEDNESIGNLEKMLRSSDSKDRWDARLIARAYRNPARWIENLTEEEKHPKIAVDYSGILLENLATINASQASEQEGMDADDNPIRDVIDVWRQALHEHADSIEFAGTAYAHCYFPVTPEQDWTLQIDQWKKTFTSLFGTEPAKRVKGFWLPEMGVPPTEKLGKLVRLLKDRGYEWLILPLEAIKAYKGLSFEKQVEAFAQPHILRIQEGSITVIFRPRYDFIDQQAGCDANGVYQKCLLASRILERTQRRSPALVVPASDGENGNIMMNQYFSDTFIPFFREKSDHNVGSMTVTQYIKDYPPDHEIQLETTGSSWLGSHSNWQTGDKRLEMKHKIEQLSTKFHTQPLKTQENEATLKALLMAETSCYVYWNSDFWFTQGKRMIEYAHQKMKEPN
jgi:hypothetical protein